MLSINNLYKYFFILSQINRMVLFQVRCWEVTHQGQTIPKAQQTHTGPVLDCDWSDVSLYLVDKCNFNFFICLTKNKNNCICILQQHFNS